MGRETKEEKIRRPIESVQEVSKNQKVRTVSGGVEDHDWSPYLFSKTLIYIMNGGELFDCISKKVEQLHEQIFFVGYKREITQKSPKSRIKIMCRETGFIYNSQSEMSRSLDIPISQVRLAIKGKPIYNKTYLLI